MVGKMAQIMALAVSEPVRVDSRRLGDIVTELGETAAQNVIGLALEQLATVLAATDASIRSDNLTEAARQCDLLARLAWQIGLLSLAGVAMDLGACTERREKVAIGAVHARLMRVGNRSLTAIWDDGQPG